MISDTTTSARYIVTDGVLGYSIPFRIYTEADVAVFWSADARADTKLTLGAHYTITILTEGGTVNLLPGVVPVGAILAVVSNIPATQEADFSSTSTVNTEALERQLDRHVQMVQQLGGQLARAVILPATSDKSPQDVVQAVYTARDDAQSASSAAQAARAAADQSAANAAASANTAAQTVQAATAEAVNAATGQADAAAASAAAAAQSAVEAAEAVPENLVQRVTDVEAKTNSASTTARGIGRVATAADALPDSTITNGPAFLDAATVKITPTPTANAIPQADANGKLDAYLTDRATVDLNNVTNNAIHFYFYARDEKPTGTSGGSTTGNAWQTRDINTVVHNNITGASLSSHRVSLPAGRYYIRATIPVYAGNLSRAALYNNTSSAYLLYGPSARADFTANVFMSQVVDGEITLTGPSAIELRMWVQTSYASGMGIATSTPGVPEIYSEIRIWKM